MLKSGSSRDGSGFCGARNLHNLESHFKKNNSKSPKKTTQKSVQGPMGHLAGFPVPLPRGPHSPFLTAGW